MTGRERVLAMLSSRAPDHLPLMPITMMFAARHIGARYRDYAADYRVLAEAQLRTAETFQFDYVSAISDPAREASDLGAAIQWFDDQPPAIVEERALLADKGCLARLRLPDPVAAPRMLDRVEAVRLLRERAGDSLIVEGWVEGPCAMSADLRGLNTLMLDFFDDPAFVRDLFAFTVEMELGFARAQIAAGADLIGIGDAAASLIGPRLYAEFVQPAERLLVEEIQTSGAHVRLHICGKTRRLYRGMAATAADIIDLDSMSPLAEARAQMGDGPVLLGNLDPVRVMRDGTPAEVAAGFARCHRDAGPRYIVGAGCEVPAGTPAANLRAAARYAQTQGHVFAHSS
jgi:MtaA/CmuA family methyltransferase